jgi:acetyl-CoA carboxylase biotin carboxylase subunit
MHTVLVANRGEIAVRVIRALRDLGLRAVAVYSDADADARHVQIADEALRLGPGPAARSYLAVPALLAAIEQSGADAVHPGYGFLSENAAFAAAVTARGWTFIGPTAETITAAGSKLGARERLAHAGVPVVPGSQDALLTAAAALETAAGVGYPIMLKASAGGGGRGMRIVHDAAGLPDAFAMAQGEARAAFGDPTLYIEKLIVGARHIEVQILGDGRGGVIHLGERNCSVQRRHQKLIEEAPSPTLPREIAARLHDAACRAGRALEYRGAGTVEFLVDASHHFYFLEINARIQVEHPVTEMITGVDLVKAQIQVAQTGVLPVTQDDIRSVGHAIECRINAEDPDQRFLPQPGTIDHLRVPGGFGVRFDSHIYQGYRVPVFYDSLLGKLIGWGPTRPEAVAVLARALREFEIGPIKTTAPLVQRLIAEPAFVDGSYDLAFLPTILPDPPDDEEEDDA